MLNILLRMNDTCSSVSSNRTVGRKKEVMKFCFDSLIKNIKSYGKDNINLQIFYDDLCEEMLSMVMEEVNEENIHKVTRNPELSKSMSTFNELYKCGRNLKDPILLLEDDYYFYPNSLEKIMAFYDERKKEEEHFCINIMEDFTPRLGDKDEYLFEVDNIKWRKTTHTTLTIFTDAYILNKYEHRYLDYILNFQKRLLPGTNEMVWEGNTISKVYDEVNCYAPTPSLTEHLQNWETLSRNSIFYEIRRGETIDSINKNIWK